MKRGIRLNSAKAPAAIERLSGLPEFLRLGLDPAVNRCVPAASVKAGEHVHIGHVLARCEALSMHAPVSGTVREAGPDAIVLQPDYTEMPPLPAGSPAAVPSAKDLPEFAAQMGLAGMGGSLFPASLKFRAATAVRAIVLNAVECEPGIEIDAALLAHELETVCAGLDALCMALGVSRRILAARKSAVPWIVEKVKDKGFEILAMRDEYPAGAEKLIVGRLEGRMPPAGVLPVHLGYLVLSVASAWAFGRRVRDGLPSIERPLSLVIPGDPVHNLVAPVGTPVGHLLGDYEISFDPARHVLVAGGMMMGRRVEPDQPVTKGTNAVFLLEAGARLRRAAQPCILCGSCFDVCPLKLHPIGMADRVRARRVSGALKAQLDECFLCGACAAVCPSDIPLVEHFKEGKSWLREGK